MNRENEDLHKIKMRERYRVQDGNIVAIKSGKKIDGTFNDMKEQFLKTAHQRSHMKRITKHDKKILAKQEKLINTTEEKDD